MLNRNNRKMPFTYEEYIDSYGHLPFDCCTNKDSYNEILPNATSGTVDFELTFTAPVAVAQQAVFIGEYRNEYNIGFNTVARKNFRLLIF